MRRDDRFSWHEPDVEWIEDPLKEASDAIMLTGREKGFRWLPTDLQHWVLGNGRVLVGLTFLCLPPKAVFPGQLLETMLTSPPGEYELVPRKQIMWVDDLPYRTAEKMPYLLNWATGQWMPFSWRLQRLQPTLVLAEFPELVRLVRLGKEERSDARSEAH